MFKYRSPFPWFGDKSRAASLVWSRLGDVLHYVEPFFGSGAVMFLRPTPPKVETIGDADGFVANFWRAVKNDPDKVAEYVDHPVIENDLHARHVWMQARRLELVARLEGDPEYYDPKIAGWWAWCVCVGVMSRFPHLDGPWHSVDGKLVYDPERPRVPGDEGIQRARPFCGRGYRDTGASGLVGMRRGGGALKFLRELSERLRLVRVTCGDWSRCVTRIVTWGSYKLNGIFLDPPYAHDTGRDPEIYTTDDPNISAEVRAWCIENGDNPRLRIALCGVAGEHDELERHGWECVPWVGPPGAYNFTRGKNLRRYQERIWFSPHCIRTETVLNWSVDNA